MSDKTKFDMLEKLADRIGVDRADLEDFMGPSATAALENFGRFMRGEIDLEGLAEELGVTDEDLEQHRATDGRAAGDAGHGRAADVVGRGARGGVMPTSVTRELFPDRPISPTELRELNRMLDPTPEPEMVKWRLEVTFERVAVYEVTSPAGDEDAAWDVYREGRARQVEYGEEYESDYGYSAKEAQDA